MTYFEQTCHRHAIAVWQQHRNLPDWHARIISKILRYCEVSSRPTPSASMLLLGNVAAAGADIYRSRAPQFSEWTRSISSEPQLFNHVLGSLIAKTRHEVRLHQEIVARLGRGVPLKLR